MRWAMNSKAELRARPKMPCNAAEPKTASASSTSERVGQPGVFSRSKPRPMSTWM